MATFAEVIDCCFAGGYAREQSWPGALWLAARPVEGFAHPGLVLIDRIMDDEGDDTLAFVDQALEDA